MTTSIIGTRVQRVEDPELLVGGARYVDNIDATDPLHLLFFRSTLARANIASIDIENALQHDGVVAIYTASDLDLPAHHSFFPLNEEIRRPPLAKTQVNFVGEPIVAVVATTKEAALDAMESIEVSYEALVPVIGLERAVSEAAPQLDHRAPRNVARGYRDEGFEHALDGADVVVRARIVNQRVAVCSMEGNAILVDPLINDPDLLVNIWVSTQMPHQFASIAASILGLKDSQLRVVAPHVGGGFGGKAGVTAEHIVAIACAMRLRRPVKWVESRSENMVAMPHGRDQLQYVEMGLTRNGKITGLRCRMLGDAGAYGGFGGGLVLGSTRTMSQGVYDIPKVAYSAAAVITNTTPVGAFRGAGRPEAAAFLERLIDIAAQELGIDPIAIRKNNFIEPGSFPFATKTGVVYDTGDYERAFDTLLSHAGYEELRKEQQRRIDQGSSKLLGIGVSTYVEITAAGSGEFADVEIKKDGRAQIKVGTSSHGQGHATAFAMLVSQELGVAISDIDFVQSDTALVPRGNGTGGSRSLQLGGSAVAKAASEVKTLAFQVLSRRLEVAEEDLTVVASGVEVKGVPSSRLNWREIYRLADEEGVDLKSEFDFTSAGPTFPFGAHLSVVEVDVETGRVTPLKHFCVDDCGTVINPLLVEGQQHGGAAQGIAQALYEHFQYQSDGTPLTTNFSDYAIPAASELPNIATYRTETPSPNNPLGAKGIGESATVGATPAVQNAVVNALSHLGIRHIEMPCTPERVWRAINDANHPPLWVDPPNIFSDLPIRTSQETEDTEEVDI
jgi:carbon-monoxide dehydrogenase large subunit